MTPQAKIKYAHLPVPRYTSYPTAPHFTSDLSAADVTGWLASIGQDDPVSLYLHVPYCREICLYCGCHTKATRRDSPLFDYSEGLIAELDLVAAAIPRRQAVSHIHWGGGTPSLLPRLAFLAVVAAINSRFDVRADIEHAIELDPRSVTAELAATLAEAGITRVSLGVQDFDAEVQVAIGRIQPIEVVSSAVEHLRQAGLTAINFDLMYGLPHQTIAGILSTVEAAIALAPSRIALFGYAHVPWFKKQQRLIDAAALPGTQARLDLEVAARGALGAAGYRAVGLDHFALSVDPMVAAADANQLHRNFQGYTTDAAAQLIGVGASSISRFRDGFAQNALDVSHWRQAIAAGSLPTVKGKAFDAQDRLRGDLIEQLMCNYAADVEATCRAHEVDIATLADSFNELRDLSADGLAVVDGWRVTLTEEGRPFVRVVAAAFDAYLAKQTARHSAAV